MNKESLYNKLTEVHIMALYDFMCPIDYFSYSYDDVCKRKEKAFERYRNDSTFNIRVNYIVSYVMNAIEEEENQI